MRIAIYLIMFYFVFFFTSLCPTTPELFNFAKREMDKLSNHSTTGKFNFLPSPPQASPLNNRPSCERALVDRNALFIRAIVVDIKESAVSFSHPSVPATGRLCIKYK